MQKKVLIVCVGGMSSSMIARKVMQQLQSKNLDVYVEASDVTTSQRFIKEKKFDLYLISPQIKMVTRTLAPLVIATGIHLVDIPKEDYVPVGPGIERLTKLIMDNLNFS